MFYCCLVTKWCLTLCDPMDCSLQAPLSMKFPRQWYWSGLPFPSPGGLPDVGMEPESPALQSDSLPVSYQGSPVRVTIPEKIRFYCCSCCFVAQSRPTLRPCGLRPTRLCPWDFPGSNTEVGCHFLLHKNPLRGEIVFSRKCGHLHAKEPGWTLMLWQVQQLTKVRGKTTKQKKTGRLFMTLDFLHMTPKVEATKDKNR